MSGWLAGIHCFGVTLGVELGATELRGQLRSQMEFGNEGAGRFSSVQEGLVGGHPLFRCDPWC